MRVNIILIKFEAPVRKRSLVRKCTSVERETKYEFMANARVYLPVTNNIFFRPLSRIVFSVINIWQQKIRNNAKRKYQLSIEGKLTI